MRLGELLGEWVVNVTFGCHRRIKCSVVDFVEWDISLEAEGQIGLDMRAVSFVQRSITRSLTLAVNARP